MIDTKRDKEQRRLRVRHSQRQALENYHGENIKRMLSAFRAGLKRRPIQTRKSYQLTDCLWYAHQAGVCLADGCKKCALTMWRNARFVQGLKTDFLVCSIK